jgi:hypothetical protein
MLLLHERLRRDPAPVSRSQSRACIIKSDDSALETGELVSSPG